MITTQPKKQFRLKMTPRCFPGGGINLVLLRRKDIGSIENWEYVCSFAGIEMEQTNKEINVYSYIPAEIVKTNTKLRHYVTFFNADLVDLIDDTNGYYKSFYKNNTPKVKLSVWDSNGVLAECDHYYEELCKDHEDDLEELTDEELDDILSDDEDDEFDEDSEEEYSVKDALTDYISKVTINPDKRVVSITYDDHDTVIVKTHKEDDFDPYVGVALGMIYKIFDSKTAFRKWVNHNSKAVKSKPKKAIGE